MSQDEKTPDGSSRYAWNSTHDCHVCGVKAHHCCPYTCDRQGLRMGPRRPSPKEGTDNG